MKPGMDILLQLLRGQEVAGTHLPDREWEQLLRLSREQRILPFVSLRLLEKGASLPKEFAEKLADEVCRCARYAFRQRAELQEVLRALASAQLPVLLLKGPSLAERLYGRADLRVSSDLDLLVERASFGHAARVLERNGFRAESRVDDYHQAWSRGFAKVELHFDVENPLALDFNIGTAWANATPAGFHGQPAWLLSPQDEFFYLALHAARHRFGRLSYVLDLAFARRQLQPAPFQPGALREHDPILERVASLASLMIGHLHPGDPPFAPEPCSRSTDRALIQLADELWSDLLDQPPRALDWKAQHAFYLRIETGFWRKPARALMFGRILLTRLIEPDFAFAQQFSLRRPWQVWLLRWLRLLLSLAKPAIKQGRAVFCRDRHTDTGDLPGRSKLALQSEAEAPYP